MEVLEREVETLSQRLPRTIFDVPALTAKIQDLEQIAAQSSFGTTNRCSADPELSTTSRSTSKYDQWQASLEDTKVLDYLS